MPHVKFNTNIDKYKGAFLDSDYDCPPRGGEFVSVSNLSFNDKRKFPFDSLEVKRVTWKGSNLVIIDLHLSGTQAKENEAYNLGVFN